MIRQFIRLARAAREYHQTTGRHLDVYGALGELYGAMAWGIRLHKEPNVRGSDGRLGRDWVEIKTIGPRASKDRVTVALDGRNFNKLLVVKVLAEEPPDLPVGFHITGRLVERRKVTPKTTGRAGIAWSRALEHGTPPPEM